MKKVVLTVLGLLLCSIISVGQELPGNLPWEPNWNAGSSTMTVFGVVMIDGIEQRSESLVLAAFCTSDGECRDAQLPFYDDIDDRWYYMAGPSGDPGDEFTFKLFDSSGSGTILDLNCMFTIQYTEDPIGFDEAFEFTFATPSGPQPTTYPLDITGYGSNPGGYYLIASPVTVAPAEVTGDPQGMTEGNFDLYYFDNSKEQEWINYIMDQNGTINSDFGPLTPGKGYLYAREEDAELELSGELYDGDGQFDLAYSTGNPSADMRGWNLVGNPFTYGAIVDKDAFYVMNEEGRNDIIVSEEKAIAPMQGIFVLATAEGQTVKFSQALQPLVDGKVVLNLNRNRGTVIDRAIVRLGEGGTLPKFMLNPENTKIYIEQGGDDYAMVSSNEDEIPVCFKAASNGTYTLNVAVQNAELDYLHLVDNLAGTDTDLLANPNYTFEANTGDYASRFTLVLRNTTGLVEHFAFFNGHNWTVSNQGEATLQVIDVTGRLVSTKTIDGTTQLDINAAPGVYMFRLVNGSDVKVQKVVVR